MIRSKISVKHIGCYGNTWEPKLLFGMGIPGGHDVYAEDSMKSRSWVDEEQ